MIRKVARNTFFLSASQITARTVGFFYFVFLARALGVDTFGTYTFTLAFFYNFYPVADFGLERLVLRDVSRKPQKSQYYFSRLLPLRIIFGVLGYLGILMLGVVLGQTEKQIGYFAVLGLALIPYNITYLIAGIQNAREKMQYMALANISIILLAASSGVLFVWLKLSLIWLFLAYFLANLVVCLGFLGKLGLLVKFEIDFRFCRKALSQSWVFAALTILAVFYLRLSLVLVGLLKGSHLTGIYGSAFKFVEAGILIPQSLALALFPLSSKLFVNNKKGLKGIYKKGLTVLFLGGLAAGGVMFFGAKFIIPFVYGPKYNQAVSVFSILGISMILFFVNALPGNIILNSPKVKQFLPWAALNFAIAGGFCLLLIPKYSIIGAAWAVMGGEVAGLIINNLFVWQILKK